MKRIISVILVAVMLFALSASAFADASSAGNYTLYMDRNGKIVKDAGGTKVYGRLQEKIFQKFYQLMKNVPVNWDKFDYSEYEVVVGTDGSITFGKQTMAALNGTSVVSENSEVIIFETPKNFHAGSSGQTAVTHYDITGKELGTSQLTVKAISNGKTIISNICPKCNQEQGSGFHLMECGHYSCEVGEEGHGAASCGYPGHMNCDGADHSTCPNCLEPMCTGEHGVGVCKHVHSWQFAGAGFSPDHKYWVTRSYCPVCGQYIFNPVEVPVTKPEEPKSE